LRQKSSSGSDGNEPERKEIEDDGQTNPISKDLKQLVNKSIKATRQENLSYKPINVDDPDPQNITPPPEMFETKSENL
jgi:hypothetical protein